MRRNDREGCTAKECPMYKTQWTVKYGGNVKSKVVFVGEGPGKGELKLNRPFVPSRESGIRVDTAGDMIRQCTSKAKFKFGTLVLANATRCFVNEAEWTQKEVNAVVNTCREYHLDRFLKAVKPKIIVAAGKRAMQSVLGVAGNMKTNYNKWFRSKEYSAWVLVCYHPAYILRRRNLMGSLVNTFQILNEAIENNYIPHVSARGKYEEIQSLDGFMRSKLPVAIDTEGQGLDWANPGYIMLSAQFSHRVGTGRVLRFYEECEEKKADMTIQWPRITKVPLKSKPDKFKNVTAEVPVHIRQCEGFNRKLHELAKLLKSKTIKKYMMNGNFDVHVLDNLFMANWGKRVTINNYAMDVQVAAHLINEEAYSMASLTDLQREFAEDKADYNRRFEMHFNKGDMLAVPTPELIKYGGADADITLQIAEGLKEIIRKDRTILRYLVKFVMPTLKSLSVLETEGSWIDPEQLPKVMEQVHHLMLQHQYKAVKAALATCEMVFKNKDHEKKNEAKKEEGWHILTRADLVRDLLFSKAGFSFKPLTLTKSKKPSIDKHVRAELLDSKIPGDAREFLVNYTEFSEYHTLWSRYLRGFEKNIKEDGRIHSSLSLTIAVTGRVSSSKPNVMNSPKRSEKA